VEEMGCALSIIFRYTEKFPFEDYENLELQEEDKSIKIDYEIYGRQSEEQEYNISLVFLKNNKCLKCSILRVKILSKED
jgi:hypothetical protein